MRIFSFLFFNSWIFKYHKSIGAGKKSPCTFRLLISLLSFLIPSFSNFPCWNHQYFKIQLVVNSLNEFIPENLSYKYHFSLLPSSKTVGVKSVITRPVALETLGHLLELQIVSRTPNYRFRSSGGRAHQS